MIQRMTVFSILSFALVFALAQPANAQVPSSAEASRAAQQISPMDQKLQTEIGPGGVSVSPSIQNAPKGADKVKFILKSVKIDGASAYSADQLKAMYADMLGTEISLADVYGLAQNMTVKYRNDGYILTQVIVPEQKISGGNIRLQVVEGFVDQVIIRGDVEGRNGFFDGYAEKIRADIPLNAKKLERYVLLINDLPGLTARAILSPSANVRGASDVEIIVERKSFDIFSQIDNRGTRYLGPMQVNVGTRLNNPLGHYEGISLQAVTAFSDVEDRELGYLGASWSYPLNNEGTTVTVGANITSTDPGFTLTNTDVRGMAKNIILQVMHPFVRSRNENLSGTISFNYLNSTRKDNLGGGDTTDHLRVLRLGLSYQFADRFIGINSFNVEASKGLSFFGASDEGDANLTRAAGDPRFFKLSFGASRLQRLNHTFDLFVSAAGQLAAQNLLASEEFGIGGTNFGSAYDPSEITGEQGIATRVEIRANNAVGTNFADYTQAYTFYDIGRVSDPDNAVAKDRSRSLSSAGVGFRANINENIAATFEAALPLTRPVATNGNNQARFFGSLTTKF